MDMPDALLPKPQDSSLATRLDGASALLVTQYYRPELIGSAPFCGDLAEWLAAQGCVTTVLAGPPHYPQPEAFRLARERLPRREWKSGVLIQRLKSRIPSGRGMAERVRSELSFFANGILERLTGRVKKAPLVLSLCPSIMSVALGEVLRVRGGRHIAIVHDIPSGIARGVGLVRSAMLHRAMQAFERNLLNRCDSVVALTQSMKEELRRIGVVVPIEVAPIWVDVARIRPTEKSPVGAPRLLYSGNLGRKQGLEQIVELAGLLSRERPDVEIVIRGEGSERVSLQKRMNALGLTNVHFDALLPPERLAEGLADGDVHLVPQEPAAAGFAIPSKIFSIMAAGRPFVATANPGSPLWQLRRQARAFLTVRANDHRRFARAVIRLLDDQVLRDQLGRRAREFVEQNCARELVLEHLARLIFPEEWQRRRPSVLVLETDGQGHQPEWLHHLIRHAAQNAEDAVVSFVVPPELFDDLSARVRDMPGDRVRVAALSTVETRMCRSQNLLLSGFARWFVTRRYARRTQAGRVCVLALDHLSLALALGLGFCGRPLSGILFRPSVHYRLLGAYRPSWREKLRDLRKSALYRLMLRNPALTAVHSLDPYFPEFARRRFRYGEKVQTLHDPAHPLVRSLEGEHRVAARIPRDRTLFLLFGYLTERKGTLKLLDALLELAPGYERNIAVMLAGSIDPHIRETVFERLSRVRRARPDLWIGHEDRRLAAGELEALIGRANVLVAPYQRFVGSSGVLMWAARAGKPVLTQDFGMMGAIVRELGLGTAVDTTDPGAIARAICSIVDDGARSSFDREAALALSETHTPSAFTSAIFATL